jgi:hypothetical protein
MQLILDILFTRCNYSSPSNIFILVKSSFPIPTIIIDNGYSYALYIYSIVDYISLIEPSVKIRSIKYF